MFRYLPTDILYLSGELVSGKSLPVLMAIVHIPFDRVLTCIMLLLGYLFGSFFSAWSACHRKFLSPWSFTCWCSFFHMYFSTCLSLAFMLRLSSTFTGEKGVIFSLAPAYCVLCQALPQRPSTVLIILLLGLSSFYVSMITNIPPIPLAFQHPQSRISESRIPELDKIFQPKESKVYNSVWETITNAIQLFILAFYASIHHGPLQVLISGNSNQHPVYTSHFMVTKFGYSCIIHFVSGLIRLSIWICVVWFQSNMLHILLELDQSRYWAWLPSFLFMMTLLYESTWMITQITEQIFPWTHTNPISKLKFTLLTLSKAGMFQFQYMRWPFIMAQLLSILSIVNTLVSHK